MRKDLLLIITENVSALLDNITNRVMEGRREHVLTVPMTLTLQCQV